MMRKGTKLLNKLASFFVKEVSKENNTQSSKNYHLDDVIILSREGREEEKVLEVLECVKKVVEGKEKSWKITYFVDGLFLPFSGFSSLEGIKCILKNEKEKEELTLVIVQPIKEVIQDVWSKGGHPIRIRIKINKDSSDLVHKVVVFDGEDVIYKDIKTIYDFLYKQQKQDYQVKSSFNFKTTKDIQWIR
jgi:hypothetical protein